MILRTKKEAITCATAPFAILVAAMQIQQNSCFNVRLYRPVLVLRLIAYEKLRHPAQIQKKYSVLSFAFLARFHSTEFHVVFRMFSTRFLPEAMI